MGDGSATPALWISSQAFRLREDVEGFFHFSSEQQTAGFGKACALIQT
jgi:hypothetical protein